jgi:hypothetical protein
MADEERRPLFTSEVVNAVVPMKIDREPVYKTPVKKGRITTMWVGSPMHVDGKGVDGVARERRGLRKSISDLFGSPMKVDAVIQDDSPRKPLPRPRFLPRYRS